MQIPIVSAAGTIVGWTDNVPEFYGSALRHAEAERLVGGSVHCVYVQIDALPDARRAGAPANWSGPWRCLALCSEDAVLRSQGTDLLPTVRGIGVHA